MLYNPFLAQQLGEQYVKDMLREAAKARLIREAKAGRPGRLARGVAGIGRLLIAAGERLQRRYEPARNGLPASRSPVEGTFS
ncbi:MAG: hypothetical protein ACE5LU_16340 [Anaerolineae bacterium]